MSRGFRFRLEAALQQRERQEQQARQVLALVARAYSSAQMEIEQLRGRLAAEQQERAVPGTPFAPDRRMHLLLHVDRATREIEQRTRALQQRADEVRRAADLVRQAAARKRALERLRERQQAEFLAEEQRRQNQELDEHGAIRFARRPVERGEGDAPVVEQ